MKPRGPRGKYERTFEPTDGQRKILRAELNNLLELLSVDQQWALRRACLLIECLGLPKRVTKPMQLFQVERMLGVYREHRYNRGKDFVGRPWTKEQLRHVYYAKNQSFKRPFPMPVMRSELDSYVPVDSYRTKRARGFKPKLPWWKAADQE